MRGRTHDRLAGSPRRGATLILMTLLMTVFIGMAAFALDFGRFYMYRSQLQNSADAAAWAGLLRLKRDKDPVGAADTAVAYANWHRVGAGTVSMPLTNVEPGFWDFAARTFTPEPSQNWAAASNNAVRATAPMTADFFFGRVFGFTSRPLSAFGTAAEGFIGPTPCVRPWAIPYERMLQSLYPAVSPGVPYDPNYNLSQADITNLAAMTQADTISLKVSDASSTYTSGNFFGVRMGPSLYADGTVGNPTSGGSDYGARIGEPCTNPLLQSLIGPGDWLEGENGNMQGPTQQGVEDLCTNFGGGFTLVANALQPNPANANFNCNAPVEIKAAFFDIDANSSGLGPTTGPNAFRVKFVGVFTVYGHRADRGVVGYFNTMTTSGTVVNQPTPLSKLLLVQ